VICPDTEALGTRLAAGDADVLFVVVAEEGANAATGALLERHLASEPDWSRLPVVFLVADARRWPPAALRLEAAKFGTLAVVLERPVRQGMLGHVLDNQAEARHRQFATRDLLARLEASERRQAFLLSEVRHRTRNTLAVLQSLFTLTARRQTDVDSLSRTFGARLAALARAHTRLAQEPTESVPLERLLEDHVLALCPRPEQLRRSGPSVRIAEGIAFNLALAVHELATNAAKYGALSRNTGSVDVTWHVEPVTGALELVWTEAGGPPVTPPSESGLGMRVVERVGDGAAAETRLEFRPEGVRWRLRLPSGSFQVPTSPGEADVGAAGRVDPPPRAT
jgi:two-component sensor histidine kinase